MDFVSGRRHLTEAIVFCSFLLLYAIFTGRTFLAILASLVLAVVSYIRYRYQVFEPSFDLVNAGSLFMSTYVLKLPDGYLVVDTNMPFGWNSFLSTLRAENIALDEIKYIFVTHTHTDHVGFLAKLVGATNAKIIGIPETFVRLKAGEVPRSPSRASIGAMAGLMAKAMAKGGRKSQQFEAVDVPDRQLVYDGSDDFLAKLGIPGKLLVLNGHTSDSIGILLDDGRLFCGDAAGNGFPGIERHAVFVESLDDYLKSWDVMIESGAKTIYPGHGLKFPVSDLVKYRHSLDGKQLAPFPEFSD